MKKAKLMMTFLLPTLYASGLQAHTPQEGNVYATLGPSVYRTHVTRTMPEDVDEPFENGGGLIAEGDVDYNGGIEIAMLYFDKYYYRKRNDDVAVEKIKRMYITTGYRHWFFKQFSLAGAFYSAYSMGDPRPVYRDTPSGVPLYTSAREITEYGFDTSAQWEMWTSESEEFSLVADARYAISFSRKSRQDANLYALFLGVKYLVPKRGKHH